MIKLVIWDLDETLWHGTLDAGDTVRLIEERAELVRALNAHGIVSSICSKNDFATARSQLEAFGLWDEFVFPEISYQPKGEAVAAIIADMQLRAENTLFIDDNHVNLNEAMFRLSGLNTLDATLPSVEAELRRLLTDQAASRNRVAEYRNLQAKRDDRRAQGAVSDEAFLRSCEIKVCVVRAMGMLDFLPRVAELLARSNQLNYSQSRLTVDELYHHLIEQTSFHESYAFFASDRYGDHGLIGFAMVNNKRGELMHFAFSCRVMHMGVESWVIQKLRQRHANLAVPRAWSERIGRHSGSWIAELCYDDPDVRAALLSEHGGDIAADQLLRIMSACQSGGIAHYSAHRRKIDFDLYPREFDLAKFVLSDYEIDECPPYVVYGAGVHYKTGTNVGLLVERDIALYEMCAERLCQFLSRRNVQALIMLPPEDMDKRYYRLRMYPANIIAALNRVWRRLLQEYDCITLLDIGHAVASKDMVDANHLRPNGLKVLAGFIDQWFDIVTQSKVELTAMEEFPAPKAA